MNNDKLISIKGRKKSTYGTIRQERKFMPHGFLLACLWEPFIGCINDTFYGTEGEKEQA